MSADTRPTDTAYERYEDLKEELDGYLARLDTVVQGDVSLLRAIMLEWEEP